MQSEVSVKQNPLIVLTLSLTACAAACAQNAVYSPQHLKGAHRPGGQVVTPVSGIERPEDIGVRMHTNFKIFVPPPITEADIRRAAEKGVVKNGAPSALYAAETPGSLACIYGLTAWTAGCNPTAALPLAAGGSKAVAIVDAYDYPTALADLNAYSKQFGLPAVTTATFTVEYQGTAKPTPDPNCAAVSGWQCWASEAALDIEMVHAMAPKAHIYLVEANSAAGSDLFAAAAKAATLVAAAGGGEVSMSWGGSEFSGETSNDKVFNVSKVVFFAAAGDQEGVEYPSVSPNVVAVGGTTLNREPGEVNFLNIEAEITWEDGGGGESDFEPEPAYQANYGLGSLNRLVPDVAAVGNPRTGVWVYDSYDTPTALEDLPDWNIYGGTSVGTQLWAGLVNAVGSFAANTTAEETLLYSNTTFSPSMRDIVYGTCGYYEGWFAEHGWDPCTGLGAPYGKGLK
jgi:subtilase family serine protease